MRGRLVIAAIVAVMSLVGYVGTRQTNPVTGESQHVSLKPDQEIALGLQAAPSLAAQHGGRSSNARGVALVDAVGQRIVTRSSAGRGPYRYAFHLLDDDRTINAFALPGGQVFITDALAKKLRSEGQMAGVLAHEVAHVVGRHGAEHLAKGRLIQGLGGAAVIATYDRDRPGRTVQNAAIAAAVGQLINMKFGRDDELESDRLGVRFMAESGYDPRAMIKVMEVLREAGGSRGGAEFFSTHPNPQNRIQRIQEAIQKEFPNGVPGNLQP